MQGLKLDEKDIYILRILAKDCRTSYRQIGLELGLTTNTVRNRIKRIVKNKIIERFVLSIDFSVFGYKKICLLIIRRNMSPSTLVDKLSIFGNVYLQVDCLGGISVFSIVMKQNMQEIGSELHSTIKPAVIYNLFTGELTSRVNSLLHTDLKIIKLLLDNPRMNYENIAKAISVSKKTIKRRLEFMAKNRIINFGIVQNPSAMKGYMYFGLIIHIKDLKLEEILEQVYQNFEEYFLRPPSVVHKDVIILNLFSDNVYDVESLLKKAESFAGVDKAEIFLSLKSRVFEDWIHREIDSLLQKT